MGPLLALGIGLIPTLIGGLFGQKPQPAAPPPPDHTPELLKAMEDQHKEDMNTINRLIDKLDAKDRGNTASITLDNPNGQGGTTPVNGTQTPAAGGPTSPGIGNGTNNGAAATGTNTGGPDPKPVEGEKPGDITGPLMGIMQELIKLMTSLTNLLGKLIPAGPQPAPAPIPLTAAAAKAAATPN